jgi:hypothetical protein
MGTDNVNHFNSRPTRSLIRQKRVVAQDYPFFNISLWKCNCGCETYSVTLQKADIGYVKKLFDIEFNTLLEAFIRFEKFVNECEEGSHAICIKKEGETFE